MSSRSIPRRQFRWYRTASGRPILREEIKALGPEVAAELAHLAKLKRSEQQLPRQDAPVRGRIRALKTTYDGNEYRLLYASVGPDSHILLGLVVLQKTTQQLPPEVVRQAEERLADWESREGAD